MTGLKLTVGAFSRLKPCMPAVPVSLCT